MSRRLFVKWHRVVCALISVGLGGAATMAGCGGAESAGTGGAGGGWVGGGPTGGFAQGGSGGGTATGGGSTGAPLASACQADGDCALGLSCLKSTSDDAIFGGGPAGGFCTRSCSVDAECGQMDAVCLQAGPGQPGRCTLVCSFGPPIDSTAGLFSPLDPEKCLGREELRCAKQGSGSGACVPTCGSDAQCPTDRVCDPRLRVCVPTAQVSTGQPMGSGCDPAAPSDTCAGTCVGFDSGIAMCSAACVLGGERLSSADCGGPQAGLCAFHPKTNGAGDTGWCTPSCGVQADCASPSFWCFSVPGLSEDTGRGYCFGATACPNGQADCDALKDPPDTCTSTPLGSFCLDAKYPLDAPDAGAGDAGP
jgi:hypothetical protein